MQLQPIQLLTDEEQNMARSYDDARRLRLLGRIGLILSITVIFIMLDEIVNNAQLHPEISLIDQFIGVAPILLIFAAYALTVVFVRRKQVNAATMSFTLAVSVMSTLEVFRLTTSQGFSPLYLIVLESLVAIVSISGAAWTIIGTAGLSSLMTIYGMLYAPHVKGYGVFYANAYDVIIVAFIFYWATVGSLLLQWRSYQRTLEDLNETRVQYVRSKRVEELKDQFITSVNHELRNPVMTVIGYLDIMKHSDERDLTTMQPLIDEAFLAGEKLQALVESILETRQIEQWAESFAPESVNIYETVMAAAATVSQSTSDLTGRDLHVQVPHDLMAWSETVRLRQVLTNLLSNAVKYSSPGTSIDVQAQLCEAKDDMPANRPREIELTVRDHGLGIPPDQIPLLFERFVRLERDITSHVPGNGLGLYLCKTLVTAMGGAIWAESTGIEGDGTTFYIHLPAARV